MRPRVRPSGCRPRERGFSLVETMVALLLAVIVFGAAFVTYIDESRVHHGQTQQAEMRQNGRNAVEMMSREIVPAGYGMASMPTGIDAVIANEPTALTTFSSTAITLRYNSVDVWSTLSDDMPQPSSELKVTTTAGFAEGMRVMVWDRTGTWDWVPITQVQDSEHLQHNTMDLTKAYTVADGTIIDLVSEIAYRYDATARQVQRQENAGPWLIVAENVDFFRIRYWDKTDTEIFPSNIALRRAVRKIGLSLRARTAETDRKTGKFKSYSVTTEIAPRNLPYLPQS